MTTIPWVPYIKSIPEGCSCRWVNYSNRKGWSCEYVNHRCLHHAASVGGD